MSTTATTVASTIIGITPVVAIVDVLKEQHVLAYFPSPLLELDVLLLSLAASSQRCSVIFLPCLWVWHSQA